MRFIVDLYADLWKQKEYGCIIALTVLMPMLLIGMWIGACIGGGQD